MSYIYGPKEIEKMVFIQENKINNYIYINGDSIEGSELFKNDVCILNFASAKNPGGGYINGQTRGQEEFLCINSNLYEHLKDLDIYNLNRKNNNNCVYHDFCIFTKEVDIKKGFKSSIITCPAPNAGVARKKSVSEKEIINVINRRINILLNVAKIHGVKNIVLGAWGCGVFKNIEAEVAKAFKYHLEKYSFDNVIFAIPSDRLLNKFKTIISN